MSDSLLLDRVYEPSAPSFGDFGTTRTDWLVGAFGSSPVVLRRDPPKTKVVTFPEVERERLLRRLVDLLERSDLSALFGLDGEVRASERGVSNAISLLRTLPRNVPLPKISLDEDGDIEFHWRTSPIAIVTVQDDNLHALFSPNTPRSTHFDEIPIVSGGWPSEIVKLLPLG